ncbi:hypothetical protein RclHR1_15190004 [Rhizophagus clarus]|uniref:Uncharacterized protein n=1 Tax=Rhizophagus clarus TaxID=94130 RepID=A0A2Z6QTN4_9GLOM|nr:hypothetical protein RclHR1_15190004 [Rhizophagus clarus]
MASDHNVVSSILNTTNIIHNCKESVIKHDSNEHIIYDYDKMMVEGWRKYEKKTNEHFTNEALMALLEQKTHNPRFHKKRLISSKTLESRRQDQTLQIQLVPHIWTASWAAHIKVAWKMKFDQIRKLQKDADNKHIEECINKRAEIIQTNQTCWINSLLNRYKDRIVLDRIIHLDMSTGKEELLTNPKDIKRYSPLQYKDLQKKQKHKFDNIPQE